VAKGSKGEGSGGRDAANNLWETEQLLLSMGPECVQVRTFALNAITPSKGFILHLKTPQGNYCTLYIFFIILYIFLSSAG
jgi:hypothetical protein